MKNIFPKPYMGKICTVLLFLASTLSSQAAKPCRELGSLALPATSVTMAVFFEAGAFDLPRPASSETNAQNLYRKLPSFCRVAATIKPAPDSEIKLEVWLPSSNWNGRLQVVGNGGWAGSISYPAMAKALAAGYATASTNTGHDGERASFAPGHPEKLIDFAWRAAHLTTVKSKSIVAAFYGSPARYSYWNGCSSGGRQGLKEAQKFPNDFDGLVVGAPANNWVRQKAGYVAKYGATHRSPESAIPKVKYEMIHEAVLRACDALDGVEDGILENPRACHFDPSTIQCKNVDGPGCLTAQQVATLETLHAAVNDPRTGAEVSPGAEWGTERALGTLLGNEPRLTQTDLFTYIVFDNPYWDPMTFNLQKDLPLAEKMDSIVGTAATDPDLTPLFAHNGKLLLYHGFSDPNIMPGNTINYYQSAVAASGGSAKTKDSLRLFMIPGMEHCGGGEGPNEFDMMSALAFWVEQGKTPERVIASRITAGVVTRTRPLCAYPKMAKYTGSGSTDDEANFMCHP